MHKAKRTTTNSEEIESLFSLVQQSTNRKGFLYFLYKSVLKVKEAYEGEKSCTADSRFHEYYNLYQNVMETTIENILFLG